MYAGCFYTCVVCFAVSAEDAGVDVMLNLVLDLLLHWWNAHIHVYLCRQMHKKADVNNVSVAPAFKSQP